jgi:hypothetical protein
VFVLLWHLNQRDQCTVVLHKVWNFNLLETGMFKQHMHRIILFLPNLKHGLLYAFGRASFMDVLINHAPSSLNFYRKYSCIKCIPLYIFYGIYSWNYGTQVQRFALVLWNLNLGGVGGVGVRVEESLESRGSCKLFKWNKTVQRTNLIYIISFSKFLQMNLRHLSSS